MSSGMAIDGLVSGLNTTDLINNLMSFDSKHITPVVVVCGSTFIDTAFRREFTTDTIRYAVPLMSVTMYDAFFGEAAEHGGTQWDSSFLHCLGNTHLVEGAAWACNAK